MSLANAKARLRVIDEQVRPEAIYAKDEIVVCGVGIFSEDTMISVEISHPSASLNVLRIPPRRFRGKLRREFEIRNIMLAPCVLSVLGQ